METKLVIFLGIIGANIIISTLVLFLAFRAFSNAGIKITRAVRKFERKDSTRTWIRSLHSATENFREFSDRARESAREFDPALARIQEDYRQLLARADMKLDDFGDVVLRKASQMHDIVEKPAGHIAAFSAGLRSVALATENIEEEN